MKNTIYYRLFAIVVCGFFLLSGTIRAQSSYVSDTVYTVKGNKDNHTLLEDYKTVVYVDEVPKYKGGQQKMHEYIDKHIRYPKLDREDILTSRRVKLKYTITADGKIENVSVIKGIAPQLDAEAVRLIESLPKMEPGKKARRAVPTLVTYTVIFKKLKSPLIGEDRMPSFPGGEKAMLEFISANLKYPKSSQERETEGRVIVRFIVGKTGEITDVTIMRSVDVLCDAEAARVIKSMPVWEPGLIEGEPVQVYFTLPIVYRLRKPDTQQQKKR